MTKNTTEKVTPLRKPLACPQCGQASNRAIYPFCSKRCADLDLGSWLGDKYRISGSGKDRSSDAE